MSLSYSCIMYRSTESWLLGSKMLSDKTRSSTHWSGWEWEELASYIEHICIFMVSGFLNEGEQCGLSYQTENVTWSKLFSTSGEDILKQTSSPPNRSTRTLWQLSGIHIQEGREPQFSGYCYLNILNLSSNAWMCLELIPLVVETPSFLSDQSI